MITREKQGNLSFSGLTLTFVVIFYLVAFVNAVTAAANTEMPTAWWVIQVLIISLSVLAIFLDGRAFSLNKMHWYFIFAFMGLAPIVQLSSGYFPWGFSYSSAVAVKASAIVLLWCILYLLVYGIGSQRDCGKEKGSFGSFGPVDRLSDTFLIVVPLVILAIKFILNGQSAFVVSGVLAPSMKNVNVATAVLDKSLSAVPVFCLAAFKLRNEGERKIPFIPAVLTFVVVLLILNPLVTSRYLLGSVLLGLFIVFFPAAIKGRRFDFIVLIALFVFFPLMTDWARVNDGGLSLGNLQSMVEGFDVRSGFEWVDFDAYSLLARTLIYVDNYGCTFGNQLLTALFFFVPDSIWAAKGQMTSDLLVDALSPGGQKNLSTPLMAEGYIDFGVMGVVVYSVVLALMFKRIDCAYWLKEGRRSLLGLAYPFALGFVVFLMRGTLLYGYMWTLSFYLGLAILLVVGLAQRKDKNER